jgi:hypothetical protein
MSSDVPVTVEPTEALLHAFSFEQGTPITPQHPRFRRAGQVIAGAAMLGVAAYGVGAAANHAFNLDRTVSMAADNATPSDALSQDFLLLADVAAVAGAIVLAKRGGHYVRIAASPERQASHDMAHATKKRNKSLPVRALVGGSLVLAGAGAMFGNFYDTSNSVSSAQSNVAGYFNDILGTPKPGQDNFVITNSPAPELANTSNISVSKAGNFITSAEGSNVTVVPINFEWHAGERKGQEGSKIQLLTASLPEAMTGLPEASEDCSDVSVKAAKELGVAPGATFTIDGVSVKIREVLPTQSGLNLIPVLFNNKDFARCIKNNPEQAFTTLLAQGDKETITQMLKAQGLSSDGVVDRAFVIPSSEFIDNTKKTGENNVDPLVLQAMLVSLFITGAALGNRSRARLATNRLVNTVHESNGMDMHMINRQMVEVAESEAFKSGLLAMPLVLLVDTIANGGIPGSDIGPSTKTALVVLGGSWMANRVGTSIAMRRERRLTDLAKGQE